MNRLSILLVSSMSLGTFACSSPEKEQSPRSAISEAKVEKENVARDQKNQQPEIANSQATSTQTPDNNNSRAALETELASLKQQREDLGQRRAALNAELVEAQDAQAASANGAGADAIRDIVDAGIDADVDGILDAVEDLVAAVGAVDAEIAEVDAKIASVEKQLDS